MQVLGNTVTRSIAHPALGQINPTPAEPLGVAAKMPPQQRMVMKWTTVNNHPVCHWELDAD